MEKSHVTKMLDSLVVHHKFDHNFYLKIAVLIKTESNLFQVKMYRKCINL